MYMRNAYAVCRMPNEPMAGMHVSVLENAFHIHAQPHGCRIIAFIGLHCIDCTLNRIIIKITKAE